MCLEWWRRVLGLEKVDFDVWDVVKWKSTFFLNERM